MTTGISRSDGANMVMTGCGRLLDALQEQQGVLGLLALGSNAGP